MSYRVSMSPQAAQLLAKAPPNVRNIVRRHLEAGDRERANAMKEARTRLVFIFDEPMMLLQVGRYTVLYEMEPGSNTVRVRHVTGPSRPVPPLPKAREGRGPKGRPPHRSSGGPSSQ